MTDEPALREPRPVDESRAARMVLATITGDGKMFGLAAEEALEDEFCADGRAGAVGAFYVLSRVLASSIVQAMGHDEAVSAMQRNVMGWAVRLEPDTTP
jgi:hypothetical protein